MPPELSGVTQVAVDLTDADAASDAIAAARADALVHLAAIAVPFSAPEDVILRTNATLALNVLSSGVAAGIPRIITASSPTVLGYGAPTGWLPDRFPLDEETPPQPWNAYGLSKLLAEQMIAMFARQTGDATRFAAFRPCYVIAPEEWRGAPTQQGHTVRERLDDPALSAPALFNYVDARDVATFVDVLIEALPDDPERRGLLRRRRRRPRPRAARRLLPGSCPGTDELAAGLTGTSPAFSNAKARRMLGLATRPHLARRAPRPADAQTRKDAPDMDFDGILFFPVTPFDADGRIDDDLLREHVSTTLAHAPGGVFPACGTGEFHALSADEVGAVVRIATETVGRPGAGRRRHRRPARARDRRRARARPTPEPTHCSCCRPYLVGGPAGGTRRRMSRRSPRHPLFPS